VRACIIYDTIRGSTLYFAKWIKDELEKSGIETDIKRVNKVDNFNYDLFIIGSPIYWERPLKSVISFLDNHKLELKDKKIAIFIVCIAQMFGKPAERYIKIRYLRPLEKRVSNLIIESGIFKRWLKNPNFNEREKVKNWVRKLNLLYRNSF